jgi:glycosyltransferase involved in cell wall biosynthesis
VKTNIVFQASVFSLSGYGAHARDLAISLLDDNRFNVSIIPTGWGASSTVDCLDEKTVQKLIFGVNNKISPHLSYIFIHLGLPSEFERKGAYNVGITAGLEATRISQKWVDGCNLMDLVIVSTNFMRDTFLREGVTKPVLVVNEGVDDKIFNLNPVEQRVLDPAVVTTTTNFLSIGQCQSFMLGKDRKQTVLLLDTFVRAFDGDASVGLIIKTHMNNISSPDRFNIKKQFSRMVGRRAGPKIYLLHGELTELEMAGLYKDPLINAYVSMSSGEGWNRPAAEAMACGLPIIITGWSGHMDYLNSENAILIDYKFQDVPLEVIQAGPWFEKGMKWAYPDVASATEKMRYVKEAPAMAKADAERPAVKFAAKYNKETAYKIFTDTISRIALPEAGVSNNTTII